MHFIHSVTAVLALGGSALASPTEKRATVGLSKAMRQRGRRFIGTALTLRDNAQELAIVENRAEFNSITPENAQKWFDICSLQAPIDLMLTLIEGSPLSPHRATSLSQTLIAMSISPPTTDTRSTATTWSGTASFPIGLPMVASTTRP